VRRAIAAELRLATDELADDLGVFCDLLVNQMPLPAAALLDVAPEDGPRLLETASRQLRPIVVGRHHWPDAPASWAF
jgi:hypothetical protein